MKKKTVGVSFHLSVKAEIERPADLSIEAEHRDLRAEALVFTKLAQYFTGGMDLEIPGFQRVRMRLPRSFGGILIADPRDMPD